MGTLGHVGIIANPAAQSGAAAAAAKRFTKMLCGHVEQSDCRVLLTERPGHAVDMAREAGERYDTLIVIGGDGIVHEAANGLMRVPREHRPRFAVVPVGSGNDYALTLGMSGNLERAMHQILACNVRDMDVGCVNGTYFVETMSFGIDAAIALDTVDRRKRTGRHGTILYVESGFDQIVNHRVANEYEAALIGVPGVAPDGPLGDAIHLEGSSYIFAVQIGKTYGGHFKVCPDADPTDGLFDICIAHPPLSAAKALFMFMMAKGGRHAKMRPFEFHRASALTVQFASPPAAQTDGERLEGTQFVVSMLPRELSVVVGDVKW